MFCRRKLKPRGGPTATKCQDGPTAAAWAGLRDFSRKKDDKHPRKQTQGPVAHLRRGGGRLEREMQGQGHLSGSTELSLYVGGGPLSLSELP